MARAVPPCLTCGRPALRIAHTILTRQALVLALSANRRDGSPDWPIRLRAARMLGGKTARGKSSGRTGRRTSGRGVAGRAGENVSAVRVPSWLAAPGAPAPDRAELQFGQSTTDGGAGATTPPPAGGANDPPPGGSVTPVP